MNKTTMVEISIGTVVGGELRQASAEVEVPDGAPWEAAAGMAAAFGAAYAAMWSVSPGTVHVTVTLVQGERTILRSGDVPCDGRLPRSARKKDQS